MESDWERSAKRAAVEAIERRIDHNERVRRRAELKRRLSRLGSMVMGLLILAGLGFYVAHRSDPELLAPFVECGKRAAGAIDSVKTQLDGFGVGAEEKPGKSDGSRLNAYVEMVNVFLAGEAMPWKEAPVEMKPKTAPDGTVYRLLVLDDVSYSMYRITKTGGKLLPELISPFHDPLAMKPAVFKEACSGKTKLIACGGKVFAHGDTAAIERWKRGQRRK